MPLVRWAMAALLQRAWGVEGGAWEPMQVSQVERVAEHFCAASYGDALFGLVLSLVMEQGAQEAAVRVPSSVCLTCDGCTGHRPASAERATCGLASARMRAHL